MKIIYLLILSLFISFSANAVDIYKCKTDKGITFGGCGYVFKCFDPKTKKNITNPFAHSYDFKINYTVLVFKDKLIVKSDYYKDEFIYEQHKSDYFIISNHFINVFAKNSSFFMLNSHFYHEVKNRPAKIINSGKCEKE